MEKSCPTHQDWKPHAKHQMEWGHSPPTSRLPKVLPGTEPSLIAPRDKAPPSQGTRFSSTCQWSGTSPSHQETCNKPLYQLHPQGGRHQKQERLQPSCLQKGDHMKSYTSEKTEIDESDEGIRKMKNLENKIRLLIIPTSYFFSS